jgi:hypothetical protein
MRSRTTAIAVITTITINIITQWSSSDNWERVGQHAYCGQFAGTDMLSPWFSFDRGEL